ncbi:DNA-binding transcriptional regulator, AcrR family [Allopseudospirillum japonicum]|uniref:DNA-binding transcriptional regulator, AcrR family n=1 Tax=Allopseudospirillum japonicum TaxID=64971 RepID=A0A1H6RN08_9GAMM|nr:TetR/AcrR family transcriptional regulator [Allopseudospirillum japonicum]SEI57141.1 DNA-binding transcriptional regulator, AcrR family [Allopseudospirillum japonicum]
MTLTNNSKRRKELVAIAARLFFEQGYERTTVRILAEAMGIKSGSLFHHFTDKQAILCAVIESGMQSAMQIAHEALEGVQDPQDKLLALTKAHLSTLLTDRNAHVVALYEWRSLTPESLHHLVGLRDEYESLWRSVIQECIQADVLHGEESVVRHFALGALNWTVQWYDPQGQRTPDDLALALVNLLMDRTHFN